MKRALTEEEIDDVCRDLGTGVQMVSNVIRESMMTRHRDEIRRQLRNIQVYPEVLPRLRTEIHRSFMESMIQPGENVGVLCAQSIGEKQTQSTLNSFHAAGIAVQMVLTGVPRFMEILNATKEPKVTTSRLFLRDKSLDSSRDIRIKIASALTHVTLGGLIRSYTIFCNTKTEEIWYHPYSILYDSTFRDYDHGITLHLDKKKMYKHHITMYLLKEKIESTYQDIHVVFSPLHVGQVDVFVDISEVDTPPENTLFLNDQNYIDVYLRDVVMEKLQEITIAGIQGIRDYFIQKTSDRKWYIDTVGNNFVELMGNDTFESDTVMSNNMWDIYHCLGIEAARQFLFEELWNLVTSDGSFINPAHVLLLVDIMTHHGSIVSISRYGIKKDQTGVLGRASFEESTDHFLNAAFFSEKEPVRGVSASIICGKRSRMGTGLCELVMNLQTLVNIAP